MAWNEPLTDAQWQRLRAVLREWSGMDCPDNRRGDLQEATLKAARYAGGVDFETLLTKLQDKRSEALRNVWLSAFTIHETYFFRDAPQWKAIRDRVLPERIEARRSEKVLKVWSAGCSSGEEAYTAAIVLHQVLPDPDWTIRVIGTDISEEIIAKARKGLYREWSFRQTPLHVRDDYFVQEGGTHWKIKEHIARQVRFEYLNLKTGDYPSRVLNLEDLDLILCRNVLIYFARDEMHKVITRLTDCLAPGGYLALGPAEPFPADHLPLDLVVSDGATLYRRKVAANPTATDRIAQPPRIAKAAATDSSWTVRPQVTIDLKTSSASQSVANSPKRALPTRPAEPVPAPAQPSFTEQAHALADACRWEEALTAAESAVAEGPQQSDSFYLMALALKELGRLDESRVALRKSLFIDKTNWMAHLLAAGLWQREGHRDRAKSHLTAILDGLAGMDSAEILAGTGGINVGRMRALAESQLKHLEGRN